MQKQFWILLGSVAVIFILVSGEGAWRGQAGQKTAELGGSMFPAWSYFATSSATSSVNSSTAITVPSGNTFDLKALTTAITAAIDAANTSTPNPPPAPAINYQYRYLTNVDECTLNKLGIKNWAVLSMGSVTTDNNGGPYYAADCHTSVRGNIDWVLFEKQSAQ